MEASRPTLRDATAADVKEAMREAEAQLQPGKRNTCLEGMKTASSSNCFVNLCSKEVLRPELVQYWQQGLAVGGTDRLHDFGYTRGELNSD